jgi:hypothetical protein
VPYFHLVFTMPSAIAGIALQNKAVVYDILFQAAAETVRTLAADPEHLGAAIGMTAVLHTWGQNLFHHPAQSIASCRAAACRPRAAGSPAGPASSLLASSPPVAKAEGADPKRASRDPL